MSIPLFFPPATFVPQLLLSTPVSIKALCELAGIECRASGAWTGREIETIEGGKLRVTAEPGDWGRVRIEIPKGDPQKQALLALAVLAYGMHDLVAKQSLLGNKLISVAPPRGRPRKARPLSGSERQRRFRERMGKSKRINSTAPQSIGH